MTVRIQIENIGGKLFSNQTIILFWTFLILQVLINDVEDAIKWNATHNNSVVKSSKNNLKAFNYVAISIIKYCITGV